jgi:SHS2 domain-containing protein
MPEKEYELLEHTADTGIRVKAGDLKGLFEKSAVAMFEIISEPKSAKIKVCKKVTVQQDAEQLGELYINWLNELLSLSAAKELVFSRFKIDVLNNHHLEAVACGAPMEDYRVNAEIKAATYHQLKLDKTSAGWVAEVIFDV